MSKIIQVKCWKSDCPSPPFLTPGRDNYVVIADSPDAGTFTFQGLIGPSIRVDEKTRYEEIDSYDYLVVYCDSNHKNYLPIAIQKEKQDG